VAPVTCDRSPRLKIKSADLLRKMVSPLNGGVDGRQRGHVEDAAHGAGWRQDVRRPSGAKQDGTDGHALSRHDLQGVERDVGRIEVRHDEQVCSPAQPRIGNGLIEDRARQRRIRVHLSIDLEIAGALLEQGKGVPHLAGRGRVGGAEVRMRQ